MSYDWTVWLSLTMISYFIQNVAWKKQSLHNDIRKLDPEENVQSMQYDMCQIGIENRLMHILSFVLPFVFYLAFSF